MSAVLVTGANGNIGSALIRRLIARPQEKYPLIIGVTRGGSDEALRELVSEHKGRVFRVLSPIAGNPQSVEGCVKDIAQIAPDGINVLINNAAEAKASPERLPAFSAAVNLRSKVLSNSVGPMLLACGLHSANLLRAPSNAPPKTCNFPTTDLSSISSSMSDTPYSHVKDIPSSPPTTAPHYERTSETVNVPIIMNIWSTQGSMKWTGEMWEGGSTRDELVFNPVYAASKAALSALSMHLAREMRNEAIVNCVHPGWVKSPHGRTNAPLTPDDSAEKLIKLFESWRTTKDSGQWLNEEGQKVPF